VFLLLCGFFTFASPPFGNFLETNQATLSYSFFPYHPWLYLILTPPISMRLWSEEQKSGTIEILFTLPLTITEAVIGKFIAAWLVVIFSLLLTFPLVITVNWLGMPDNSTIITGYAGSILISGSFIAIGSFTSAITKNQIISYIISVALCLILILAGQPAITDLFINWAPSWFIDIISELSVVTHFNYLQMGIIDFADLVYFFSVIVFGIISTGIILKTKTIT
jgi:ABC-2 type transport system permease protein